MEKHQYHFGRKFYLQTPRNYWACTKDPKMTAHRWVWMQHHGEIPNGYHIHHRDGNRSNNSIENLQLMEKGEHHSHHANEFYEKKENREKQIKFLDSIRDKTKDWHRSEEGHHWHVSNGRKSWSKKNLVEISCVMCGCKVKTKDPSRQICSMKCHAKLRRDRKIDNENRTCVCCGKLFNVNKYKKTVNCSLSCAAILKEQKRVATKKSIMVM